jgi:hypothetical protein
MMMIVIVTEDDHPSAAVIFSLSLSESSITLHSGRPPPGVETATSAVPPMSSRTQPGSAKRIWRQIGDSGTAAEGSPHEAVVGEDQQKNKKSPDYCWSRHLLQTLDHDPMLLLTYWKPRRHPGPRDGDFQTPGTKCPGSIRIASLND